MSISWVRVADLPEAGPFAGRVGWVGGWSSLSGAPDSARGGDPVFGAHIGGSGKSDIVYSINFDETGQYQFVIEGQIRTTVCANDRQIAPGGARNGCEGSPQHDGSV